MSTASSFWFSLYISFTTVSSHSWLLVGRCTCSKVKYIKCAQQPQVYRTHAVVCLNCQTGIRVCYFRVRIYALHVKPFVSLKYIGRNLSVFWEVKAKKNVSMSTEKELVWLSHFALLHKRGEGISFHDTQPQKTLTAIGSKTTKKIIC